MKKVVIGALTALMLTTGAAHARDQVKVVGSSTVFPFATAVAENFGKTTEYATPIIESTGSGGGLKLFCEGLGVQTPDVTNASRQIKQSEIDRCAENGVTNITEVLVGYDGIVLANSKDAEQYELSLEHIFLALAAEVPVNGELVPNPHKKWSDIDPSLPNKEIQVLGPPPTSGTRDAFVEIAMEGGAKQIPFMADLRKADKKAFKQVAHTLRADGAYVEAGENDNLIVQKLDANPDALGIFGFSFLDSNRNLVQGSVINGAEATFDAIADGSYPVSRSLFFYVKDDHRGTIPGLNEYVQEFVSDDASGEWGYLTDKGLIPAGPNVQRQKKL